MKNGSQIQQSKSEKAPARLPYVPPELKRVDLALEETLSSGCKLATDNVCVGPPITAYDGGS
jgi:hypothetical protein